LKISSMFSWKKRAVPEQPNVTNRGPSIYFSPRHERYDQGVLVPRRLGRSPILNAPMHNAERNRAGRMQSHAYKLMRRRVESIVMGRIPIAVPTIKTIKRIVVSFI